jgi:hypothetical protein
VGPNAASPGFVIAQPASGKFDGLEPTGQTLTFLNRKVTNDPPCQDCKNTTPTPTTTPSTPTATPTTPTTTATPPTVTNTPVPPTATPTTPISNVGGEKTPGPGQTPIAPSTGDGFMDGTAGGFNLLLILAGLAALTGGLGFLALGRRK